MICTIIATKIYHFKREHISYHLGKIILFASAPENTEDDALLRILSYSEQCPQKLNVRLSSCVTSFLNVTLKLPKLRVDNFIKVFTCSSLHMKRDWNQQRKHSIHSPRFVLHYIQVVAIICIKPGKWTLSMHQFLTKLAPLVLRMMRLVCEIKDLGSVFACLEALIYKCL